MKLNERKVEIYHQTDPYEHVAKCASMCYQSKEKLGDTAKKFYDALVSSKHVSTLRHESCYYIVPRYEFTVAHDECLSKFDKSPYIDHINTFDNIYIATNGNFVLDNPYFNRIFDSFKVTSEEFNNNCYGHKLMRYSIMIETTRIINDEFARKSPNCISGESTRYVNYSKDKFGGEIKIGLSDSYDNETIQEFNSNSRAKLEELIVDLNYNLDNPMKQWNAEETVWFVNKIAEMAYIHQTQVLKRLPDDSRNVLPVNVDSKFVHTYSIKEWTHIINMRYWNSTGKAHRDAYKIAEMIKNELEKLGYEFPDPKLNKQEETSDDCSRTN